MSGCLYLITGPKGKQYIGISRLTAEARFARHVKESGAAKVSPSALQAGIRKYGSKVFSIQTLAVYDDWEALCGVERKAIAAFGTLAPGGYNLTPGGDGYRAVCPEIEARRVAQSAASRTGVKLSESHRRNLSLAHKGLPGNMLGRKMTEESKQKMRDAANRRWSDPEQRSRQSVILKAMNEKNRNV